MSGDTVFADTSSARGLLASLVGSVPSPLGVVAVSHGALAIVCLVATVVEARRRGRRARVTKPLRFAVSIAIFLATMGVALHHLTLGATPRATLAWVFAGTMTLEMLAIVGQALRGTSSHFNVSGATNRAVWHVMVWAIVMASVGLLVVAVIATARPLRETDGSEMSALVAAGWRAGLWLLLLSPVSGFAMGSRMRHSVGGEDGRRGLPVVGWSSRHGDLRASHFFALHAVQILPLSAVLLTRCPISAEARAIALALVIGLIAALCLFTLVQALRGEPFLRGATGTGGP